MPKRSRKSSSQLVSRKNTKWIISLVTLLVVGIISKYTTADNIYAGNLPTDTPYSVCFTPGGNCTKLVVRNIDNAHKTILMQAYSFTSVQIAKALVHAKQRGVDVKVILDDSQFKQTYSMATYLQHQHIALWDDYKPAIAHNKIIIIDNSILMTGSFNFTQAAQNNNAENLLVLDSPALAEIYRQNWQQRLLASKRVI